MTAATIRCGAYPKAVDAYRNGFFLSARRRRGCLRNRPRGNLSELLTCDDYQALLTVRMNDRTAGHSSLPSPESSGHRWSVLGR